MKALKEKLSPYNVLKFITFDAGISSKPSLIVKNIYIMMSTLVHDCKYQV